MNKTYKILLSTTLCSLVLAASALAADGQQPHPRTVQPVAVPRQVTTEPSAKFRALERLSEEEQNALRPMNDEHLARIEGGGIYIPDTIFTRLAPWRSR
jgi:hypothetical protein